MSAIDESRFRRALRWYPRGWRAVNSEVVLGTLMDAADADERVAPTRGEMRDLRSGAAGAWLDSILIEAVRDRVSAVALGLASGMALVLGFGQWWAPFGFAVYPRPDHVIWQPLPFSGLWLVALAAALLGWLVVSRIAVVLTLPAAWLVTQVPGDDFLYRPSLFTLFLFAAFALLTLIGRATRPRPMRRALAISFGAGAVGLVAWLAIYHPFGKWTLSFPRGSVLEFFESATPSIVAILAVGIALAARRPLLAAALLVVAAPLFAAGLAVQVVTSVAVVEFAGSAGWFWPIAQAVGAVVSALIIAFVLGLSRVITRPDESRELAAP
jgi:hypothetical protein